MTNFTFSPYHLIGTIGVLGLHIFFILIDTGFGLFMDLPTLTFVWGVPFFILLATYKQTFLHFIKNSVAVLFCNPRQPDKSMSDIAIAGSHYMMTAGIMGCLIQIIQLLAYFPEDLSTLPPRTALALLPLVHAIGTAKLYLSFVSSVFSSDRAN